MNDVLPTLLVIVVLCLVGYVVITALADPVTANLAQIETAKAQQAQAAADREATRQDAATQRLQTTAMFLATAIVALKGPDGILAILAALPWVAIVMLLAYGLRLKARG